MNVGSTVPWDGVLCRIEGEDRRASAGHHRPNSFLSSAVLWTTAARKLSFLKSLPAGYSVSARGQPRCELCYLVFLWPLGYWSFVSLLWRWLGFSSHVSMRLPSSLPWLLAAGNIFISVVVVPMPNISIRLCSFHVSAQIIHLLSHIGSFSLKGLMY